MSSLTVDAITRAFTEALVAVWARRAGAQVALAPGQPADRDGWLIAVPLGGAASGQIRLWIDQASAASEVAASPNESSDASAVAAALTRLAEEALANLAQVPGGEGVTGGEPRAERAELPAGTATCQVTWPDGHIGHVGVTAEIAAARPRPAPYPKRLEAVLDVELPLIVRFGRTVMPLGAIADLSPGAVIDMGRSPDEPVELLVGDRVIGRGEVVVVAGNYGVRITELAGDRESSAELEVRAS